MKFFTRVISLFFIFCGSVLTGFGLDREAFSFTNYDLRLRIEPQQQRLGVRGKVTLRNDSSLPQKLAVLQISSSLDWRAITIAGKIPQFVTQPYTSDIDHTGALSEAIVTLPQEISPHATVDVEIGYEGVIPLDTTRLTRIGAPDEAAKSSDWDQISANFSAVRGIGHVAWYPIATEAANLSDGDSLSETLTRWRQRETGSEMKVEFEDPEVAGDGPESVLLCSGKKNVRLDAAKHSVAQCSYGENSQSAPTFVSAAYANVSRPSIRVFHLPTHAVAAATYADIAEQAAGVIANWFGPPHEALQFAEIPDSNAAPFGTGSLLVAPLGEAVTTSSGLGAAYQLTHLAFSSSRPWIDEGLAHFAQAIYLEQEKSRHVALEYLAAHRGALMALENSAEGGESDAGRQASHSLINTSDEIYMQSKAMSVWWMLRDMVGNAALKKAISLYRPAEDKEPSYMQRLIAAQTPRDLEWFFDDWVYRDRGLPDFKIESVYPRQTISGAYIVTVTIENLGNAGAEVPVVLKFGGAVQDITKRLELHAKSRGTVRVEAPSRPAEVIVNDGSVPESDTGNNSFAVDPAQK